MMSIQAWLIAIVYSILILIAIIMAISAKTPFSVALVFSFIAFIIYAVLLTYDTACLTAGQCNIWSWIRTAIYTIIPVILIIIAIIALANSKSEPTPQQLPPPPPPTQQLPPSKTP